MIDGIIIPSTATLRKYGLGALDYGRMINKQGGKCPICGQRPKNNRLVIDHQHIKGWKKMPPDKRRIYVRGLLCTYCNFRVLTKSMTLERAKATVKYLQNYNDKIMNTISEPY